MFTKIKKKIAFYKGARSARQGCIDRCIVIRGQSLPPRYLFNFAGILFILGHESYAKYILPADGLYEFGGGHCHCVMQKTQKYYLLFFTNHDKEKSQPQLITILIISTSINASANSLS